MINNYEEWAKAIAINGLNEVAQNLTDAHATLNKPAEIVDQLWGNVKYAILKVKSWEDYPALFLYIIVVLILIVALFYLTAVMILVKCEFYIVANVGVLLIGLGADSYRHSKSGYGRLHQ